MSDARDPHRGVVIGELLREGEATLRVSGHCMEPLLPDGVCVRYGTRRPWPGDVVVLIDGLGRTLVHRYLGSRPWLDRRIGRWRRLAVTRADVADRFDPEVPYDQVLGVVDEVGRQGEWLPRRTPPVARLRAVLRFGSYLFSLLRRRASRRLRRRRQGSSR